MINIVIPVFNRKKYTRQCLECLVAQTYRNFRIIVVDDGSTDGTSEMIEQDFPSVVLLHGNGNLWWTEGTNWGVRYALMHEVKGEENFVLTLNDDTKVEANYLQTLIDAYELHKPCLIGSVCVDSENPDKLEFAGTAFELYTAGGKNLAADYHYSYPELKAKAAWLSSDSLSGRGALIPMIVFKKIGLYDATNYIHYMSDIDFSVRARKAGFPLVVNTNSLVYEYVNETGIQTERRISWKEFFSGFTSIKSPTYLKARYHFAKAHSKTKLLYFVADISRISIGFLLRKVGLVKTV